MARDGGVTGPMAGDGSVDGGMARDGGVAVRKEGNGNVPEICKR